MEVFYKDSTKFILWGVEHWSVLLATVALAIFMIYQGTYQWNEDEKRKYALWFCGIMIFLQLFKSGIRMVLGNFDHTSDLPLQLCNLMPFVLFFAYHKSSRQIWAIFFFWIMAGTFQSLFTPTNTDILPHYEAIRYWVNHGGLVIMALYGFFAMGWRLKFRDYLYSMLGMNIAAAIIYPFNVWTGSNYFFLNAKPPGTTLYSLLPPWPWYILSLEWVMLLAFGLVYLLFQGYKDIPVLIARIFGKTNQAR